MRIRMLKKLLLNAALCLFLSGISFAQVEPDPDIALEPATLLVDKGLPRAQIVIAANPPRTTRLAAAELQTYLEKISGARLTIVNEPGADVPIKVYVGRSPHTEKLGVSTDGLKDGAYRVVSGENWLALIGDDTDFTPIEPWARNNNDRVSGNFVNRVAKEIGKTHPQKKILNCAYGVYTLPPLKIEKLEPNVQVCIVGGRRPTANRPQEREALRQLRDAWVAKTSHPILIFEN
jgi:hypothetical protein